MSDEFEQEGPVAVFAALGDPTRLDLIEALADGRARSITDLSGKRPISRQAVTKHLHVLEAAGLVRSQRAGREIRYTSRQEALLDARDYLDDVASRWEGSMARLKLFVGAAKARA